MAATSGAFKVTGRSRLVSNARVSGGLLMYRIRNGGVEVLLVHPGGPFFRNKDQGAWSIPKGEVEPDEDRLAAARREFEEEIGLRPRVRSSPSRPSSRKAARSFTPGPSRATATRRRS